MFVTAACKDDRGGSTPGSVSTTPGAAPAASSSIKDPLGSYKPFTDPKIRKPPAAGITIGGGERVTVEWETTADDILFYSVYYVDSEGDVRPVTNSSFVAKGGGVFTADIVVYDSAADGRPGFLALSAVTNTRMGSDGITGDTVKLGMYPVRIKLKK